MTLALSIGEDSILISAGIPPDLKIDKRPLGDPEIAVRVPAKALTVSGSSFVVKTLTIAGIRS